MNIYQKINLKAFGITREYVMAVLGASNKAPVAYNCVRADYFSNFGNLFNLSKFA